ncbi:hypothetical protein SELMODRAFT_423261 [Selaginella moellendorffii]|uniref:Uncharacterized protein n=1 Tax=Selaginella moellendorffii TaxID=88036 RepID=D8SL36_SELML|nr:hypothetical protein SELMODRAFT_423261 [Selaginella moellendorffii]
MELEVIRQLAVSTGLGDGRSEQTPIVIRGSRAGGFASGDIDRIIEAAIEKALSRRQKTTMSYAAIGKKKERKRCLQQHLRLLGDHKEAVKKMPLFGGVAYHRTRAAALSWSSVAFVMALKYELTKLYTECLGETTAKLDVIKMTQSSRTFAYAVLLCRQEIQVQKLDMDLKIVALKDRKHDSLSVRVYKANLVQGQILTGVAVKVCPQLDAELFVLGMLTKKKVAGVLPILYSGEPQNGDDYLVTRYCEQIG